MRVSVCIPLCDYESITTRVWSRKLTYQIVKKCLRSFSFNVNTEVSLYLMADRCSDKFVYMAEEILAKFSPRVIDNSIVISDLQRADLSEKHKHIANQLIKGVELSAGHDIFYFCEQDYIFKNDSIEIAKKAFDEIDKLVLLSLFDHPDRHIPEREPEYYTHKYYKACGVDWKNVSSTNGNFMWKMSYLNDNYEWYHNSILSGDLDYNLTNKIYRDGELILCPVNSLIQHFRLDGTNASPTYGRCCSLCFVSNITRIVLMASRLRTALDKL